MRNIFIFFIGLILWQNQLSAQYLDSLYSIYNDEKQSPLDRAYALSDIAWEMCYMDPDSARSLCDELIVFIKKEPSIPRARLADACNTVANSYRLMGQLDSALTWYDKTLKIYQFLRHDKGIASTYLNLGDVYTSIGNFPLGLKYMQQSRMIYERVDNAENQLGNLYNNIANIFLQQNNIKQAVEYYEMAIVKFTGCKDLRGLGNAYSNLGLVYRDTYHDLDKATELARIGLSYRMRNTDSLGMGDSYNILSLIYLEKKQFDSAGYYIDAALALHKNLGNLDGMAISYQHKGTLALEMGNADLAISICGEGLKVATASKMIMNQQFNCDCLYQAYKKKGDSKNALYYFEKHREYEEAMRDQDRIREVTELDVKFRFEKKSLEDSLKVREERLMADEKLKLSQAETDYQRRSKYFLYAGILLLIVFAVFIYNRFQVTRRQKLEIEEKKIEIEHQKELVEEKNKEILDSITYAKRLQEAILPPRKLVKEYLNNSFILYKPKDIVAGDFYWMESFAKASDSEGGAVSGVLFAAADCTGHGVPGAMVSVVCSNALNRTVKEFGITDPGKILDKVRELVIDTFSKSESEVKDGMDISLCALDLNHQKLHWAGANNPLWILRNNSDVIEEIKPNKQPIGSYAEAKAFTTISLDLNKGDCIYVFTDGYEDQFGGPDREKGGKKYKSSRMKSLFVSIRDLEMEEQMQAINLEFENWKGDFEQVDDVCVIGVRI